MHFHIGLLQFVNFMDIEMRIYMKIVCTEFVSSAMILGFMVIGCSLITLWCCIEVIIEN